jgi:hypothetical protein
MHSAISLHDAVLSDLRLDWKQGECFVRVSRVAGEDETLIFSGVRELNAPRQNPWGPSESINQFREIGEGQFEIEMQSGDVLKIVASSWQLERGQRRDL